MEASHDDQREAWLRLSVAELPPLRLRALLDSFDWDPATLLRSSRQTLAAAASKPASSGGPPAGGLTSKQLDRIAAVSRQDVSEQLVTLDRLAATLVAFPDPVYPAGLKPLPDAPPLLFVRGALHADDKFSLAIVGSRRASAYGLSIAERFSRELAGHGLTIVSGGARGIDTRAHRGALEGGGRTIAFIGCGLDVNYPAENKKLFEEIAAGRGAIVTEFALGTTPEPWRFPARNRLISGTALATMVVESPVDSGALITATDAANQGRDVFAVPGPIETGKNSGCHKLIQEGAKLVESPQDILDELGVLTLCAGEPDSDSAQGRFLPAPANLAPDLQKVLEMLTLQARHVDSLIAESGFTAPQVTAILTLLEMRGLARRVPGNAFVRVL